MSLCKPFYDGTIILMAYESDSHNQTDSLLTKTIYGFQQNGFQKTETLTN